MSVGDDALRTAVFPHDALNEFQRCGLVSRYDGEGVQLLEVSPRRPLVEPWNRPPIHGTLDHLGCFELRGQNSLVSGPGADFRCSAQPLSSDLDRQGLIPASELTKPFVDKRDPR